LLPRFVSALMFLAYDLGSPFLYFVVSVFSANHLFLRLRLSVRLSIFFFLCVRARPI
jgi:hypothetical protein